MTNTRHGMPPEFLDAADEFVQLANTLCDDYSREFVAAALMYAAARFNAFAFLTDEDRPDQTIDAATAYCVDQFERMLRDNAEELGPIYREDAD